MTTRISLWSGPRNISTALMYSFAQRSDTRVVDEPLYGFYLAQTDADKYHPAAEKTLESYEQDGIKVIDRMLNGEGADVFFYKNMTHHLLDLDRGFMRSLRNIILTRDPAEMLTSFTKVIENPKMRDVGYQHHIDLLDYYQSNDIPFLVVDSANVLKDPEEEIMRMCEFAGIPFEQSMLSWKAGARPEDGPWAPYWYTSVHKSTGFGPYRPKNEPVPPHLQPLLEECRACYEELLKYT